MSNWLISHWYIIANDQWVIKDKKFLCPVDWFLKVLIVKQNNILDNADNVVLLN